MDRFCPKCGAKGKPLIKNLCEECFWEERSDGLPNNIKVNLCRSCFSYLQGKRWIRKKDPQSAAIDGAVNEFQRSIKLPSDTKISSIEGKTIEWNKNGLPKRVILEFTLSSEGSSKNLKKEATIEYVTCDVCQHIADGKYEALVQIRRKDGHISEDNRKVIEQNIDEFYRTVLKDRSDITEIKEKEGGIDIKFLTSSKARLFAKKLSERTGANLKESAKVVGMDRMTGKKHYRTTISVKLPALESGDLVSFQNRVFRVVGHHRGKLVIEDMEDHKRKSVGQRSLSEVAKLDKSSIKRVSIGTKSGDSITVLDLDEKKFLELPAENISIELKEGDVGLLVNINGKEKIIKSP